MYAEIVKGLLLRRKAKGTNVYLVLTTMCQEFYTFISFNPPPNRIGSYSYPTLNTGKLRL